AGGETVYPPLPPPSRPPVHRARRPQARSTTDAADASLCSPLAMVFVSVPPPRAGAADLPSDRHVDNGQKLLTSLSLWHRTPKLTRCRQRARHRSVRWRQSGAAPCSVQRGCRGMPPWPLGAGAMHLRASTRREALLLRILRG